MSKDKILIIDDELEIGRLLTKILPEFNILHTTTGAEGLEMVKKEHPDIVLLDLKLPDVSGVSTLKKIKQTAPDIVTIIMTGYAEIDSAVETIKLGAYDYLPKPLPLHRLKIIINNALQTHKLGHELKELKEDISKSYSLDKIITVDKKMFVLLDLVRKASQHNITVLISGESGTGKEMVARAIHYESNRKDGPFIPVDCASLPETLIESELFGYEKGAFTGAHEAKPGKFELADGGTIFLDEIANLSDNLQIKLLRILQEREFVRLGGKKNISVDVRLVTASNKDLAALVKKGIFRNDLFYRINVFPIRIPPLRERLDDVVPLSKHFLERFNLEFNKSIKGIAPEAVGLFSSYTWPGNVRELENVIKSAVILADEWIKPEHLDGLLTNGEIEPVEVTSSRTLKDITRQSEKKLIEKVLAECKWNKRKAAQQLDIDYKTLYNKIKEYNIS